MPLYTGDYLRDTRHLTPMRHGVYLLLMMHCWDQKGPLPLDEQECAGIANCRSHDEIDGLRYVLGKYFIKMDDGWYNKRMAEEIAKAEGLSAARSKGGQISAANRARTKVRRASSTQDEDKFNLSSTPVGTPTPTPTPTPTTTTTLNPVLTTVSTKQKVVGEKSEKKSKDLSRATRLTSTWVLPLDWGNWAMQDRPELTRDNVRNIADKFRDHFLGTGGRRVDWLATWRNFVRGEWQIGNKQNGSGGSNWWMSNAGVDAQGRELGLTARGGENYESYKARIFEKMKAVQ